MDKLRRSLSIKQLHEWMAYDTLEPFGGRRGDWQAATICAMLANIAAAKGRSRKRFAPRDFLLEFTDAPKAAPVAVQQSWQQMKLIAQAISQLAYDEPKKRGRRGR